MKNIYACKSLPFLLSASGRCVYFPSQKHLICLVVIMTENKTKRTASSSGACEAVDFQNRTRSFRQWLIQGFYSQFFTCLLNSIGHLKFEDHYLCYTVSLTLNLVGTLKQKRVCRTARAHKHKGGAKEAAACFSISVYVRNASRNINILLHIKGRGILHSIREYV